MKLKEIYEKLNISVWKLPKYDFIVEYKGKECNYKVISDEETKAIKLIILNEIENERI